MGRINFEYFVISMVGAIWISLIVHADPVGAFLIGGICGAVGQLAADAADKRDK